MKVRVPRSLVELGDGAADHYLPVQLGPEKGHRRKRIRVEITGLSARIVREKSESLIAVILQQNDASRRPSVLAAGRERESVRVQNLRFHSVIHPTLELLERLSGGSVFVQL